MDVIVIGAMPLAQQIGDLSANAGYHVQIYLSGEFGDAWGDEAPGDRTLTCDLVVECDNGSAGQKRALLEAIDRRVEKQPLILSQTLATGVTEAASWLDSPQRLVGFGLVPPVSTPGLVEIAPGLATEQGYLEAAASFWRALDLEPVEVAEGPGLVRTRTVCCLINEATSALMEGIASPDDIDTAMRLGTNYPFGPLEWSDMIGLDSVLAVMNGLYREWGEERYRPSPLMKRMVLAGRLGKKSGRGFYRYDSNGDRVDQ